MDEVNGHGFIPAEKIQGASVAKFDMRVCRTTTYDALNANAFLPGGVCRPLNCPPVEAFATLFDAVVCRAAHARGLSEVPKKGLPCLDDVVNRSDTA